MSTLLEITRTDLDDGLVMFTAMCPTCGNPTRFDQIGTPGSPPPYQHTIDSAERSVMHHAATQHLEHSRSLIPRSPQEEGLLW